MIELKSLYTVCIRDSGFKYTLLLFTDVMKTFLEFTISDNNLYISDIFVVSQFFTSIIFRSLFC